MQNKTVVYLLALAAFLIGTIEYIITGIIQMVAHDLHITTSTLWLIGHIFSTFGRNRCTDCHRTNHQYGPQKNINMDADHFYFK